jgi:hypothetical protein
MYPVINNPLSHGHCLTTMDGLIFTTKTKYVCFDQPLLSHLQKMMTICQLTSNSDETNSDNELTYKENLGEVWRNLIDKIGDNFNSKQAHNLFSSNSLPVFCIRYIISTSTKSSTRTLNSEYKKYRYKVLSIKLL